MELDTISVIPLKLFVDLHLRAGLILFIYDTIFISVSFSVGRSAQVRNFSPRRLRTTSEQDPCEFCGPAHSAMAGDSTPCSADCR